MAGLVAVGVRAVADGQNADEDEASQEEESCHGFIIGHLVPLVQREY